MRKNARDGDDEKKKKKKISIKFIPMSYCKRE